jgi:5-dehydro-2-deoxygluconokinase
VTTAVVTRTGADPFGDYLHQQLRQFGVDDRWVTPVARFQTPITFCEVFPPDDFPLYFYRRPKAPDLEIHPNELDLDAISAAGIFWMTGTGLSAEPSRAATLTALQARAGSAGAAGITVFDLDWRPMFWPGGTDLPGATQPQDLGPADTAGADRGGAHGAGADPGGARESPREVYAAALRHATVAVGNLDECETAVGEREPRAAAEALLAAGPELAVVKQGPKGVLAVHRDGTSVEVPSVAVDVVNGLGAGDAFGGALCHGLLAGWDLERVMRYANAAGAIVAARLACSSAMPYDAEVGQVLGGGPVPEQPGPPPGAGDPSHQVPGAER